MRTAPKSLLSLLILAVAASARLSAQELTGTASGELIQPSDPRISVIGRFDLTDPVHPRLGYPGVTIRFRFTGGSAVLALATDSDSVYLTAIVDHGEPRIHKVAKGASELVLASALDVGPHTAEIVKRTETWQGILTFSGIRLAKDGTLLDPPRLPQRRLLFIGDSVTCGAGIDNYPVCIKDKSRPSNAYDAYGMVLGRRLDAQVHLVCYGGRGVVRDYRGLRDILNAPQFFHSSVPSDDASQRAPWPRESGQGPGQAREGPWLPQAIVVSLGTNDFNLQKSDPLSKEEFVETYVKFLRELVERYPAAIVFVTQGAIVTNPQLSEFVQASVATVADERVRWVESRHFPGSQCDAHPDLLQHRQIADDFEPVLRQALGW